MDYAHIEARKEALGQLASRGYILAARKSLDKYREIYRREYLLMITPPRETQESVLARIEYKLDLLLGKG